MRLETAQTIANRVYSRLAPYCSRIDIAGSIRRERPEVGDIEIVCIPLTVRYAIDLFQGEGQTMRSPEYCQIVDQWEKVKGSPSDKYTQRIVHEGEQTIKLDIFTAIPENYGLILAIRTGSADYARRVLAATWKQRGYHSRNGLLRDEADKIYPIATERDLFELLDLPYVSPAEREV